jgi:hypothetical protein
MGKLGLLGIFGSVIAAGLFGAVAAPFIIRLLPAQAGISKDGRPRPQGPRHAQKRAP